MSDLVGNPEDRFSHNEAHIFSRLCLFVALVVSNLDFEGGTLFLIASVSGHCLPFTSYE